ncbi:MAG: ATP phosphoribosyltransferase [Ruminococcaceae bacterium]|nr:ATP phosphoribosyltransferase [Oscillospiraceae bacterium]
MIFDTSVLQNDEIAVFKLRSLYDSFGYTKYKFSKFEEYDLYAGKKDFLVSDNVITFTDTDGKLLALKPDITLSIIKNEGDIEEGTKKVYYNENVYRVSKGTGSFKEIMQVGLECMGKIDNYCIYEVILLAAQSLSSISEKWGLDISHLGILSAVLDIAGAKGENRKKLTSLIGEKNVHEIRTLCEKEGIDGEKIVKLLSFKGSAMDMLPVLAEISEGRCIPAVEQLYHIMTAFEQLGYDDKVRIDFSAVSDINYYNAFVFKGYVDGVADSILSGGQYDTLMKKMGKKSGAIGFAVYLDGLESLEASDAEGTDNKYLCNTADGMLNVALPKGRLGEKVYSMFEAAGFECPDIRENSRKLIFENPEKKVRYFWVKPSDVAIYVERGAADIGVAGKDILLEYTPDVYELLDLDTGKCRVAVAAPEGFALNPSKTLKVATKFTNITKKFYAAKGQDIDIIKLNGSIEIAPILGLSDVIVDIVETGTTLKENHLEVIDTVVPVSARFIANKTALRFKEDTIKAITDNIARQISDKKEKK